MADVCLSYEVFQWEGLLLKLADLIFHQDGHVFRPGDGLASLCS